MCSPFKTRRGQKRQHRGESQLVAKNKIRNVLHDSNSGNSMLSSRMAFRCNELRYERRILFLCLCDGVRILRAQSTPFLWNLASFLTEKRKAKKRGQTYRQTDTCSYSGTITTRKKRVVITKMDASFAIAIKRRQKEREGRRGRGRKRD